MWEMNALQQSAAASVLARWPSTEQASPATSTCHAQHEPLCHLAAFQSSSPAAHLHGLQVWCSLCADVAPARTGGRSSELMHQPTTCTAGKGPAMISTQPHSCIQHTAARWAPLHLHPAHLNLAWPTEPPLRSARPALPPPTFCGGEGATGLTAQYSCLQALQYPCINTQRTPPAQLQARSRLLAAGGRAHLRRRLGLGGDLGRRVLLGLGLGHGEVSTRLQPLWFRRSAAPRMRRLFASAAGSGGGCAAFDACLALLLGQQGTAAH